jgi:MFS transporter, DHA1 family, multidrug resistance protein
MLRPGTFAFTLLLACLTALGPLSMDMYLPSLPDIALALHAPIDRVQLTVSSYLIGFALGQVLYGPLSDRHGRRRVILAALAFYIAGTTICAATQSIDPLIGARFLQGIGGSGSVVLARAIVRDLYSGVRAARELSLMGSITAFAPVVAPMIGGLMQNAFGWRASFVAMVMAAIAVIAMATRWLPETLHQRSEDPFSFRFLLKGYRYVLRHRGFVAYLGILTVTYAGLFAWISGAAVVLEGVYGMSAVTFGFTFALGAAGYMAGAGSAARLVVRLGLDVTMGLGVALIALGGLASAAIVATHVTDGIWLIVAMAIYLAGLGLSMPQAMAGALMPFPERAGTAASLLGVVQQGIAALTAAVVGAYLGRSAWPVAGTVAVAGCAAFAGWAFTRNLRGR